MLLLAGYLTFRVVAPFLAPLGWAAVFAMVLNPVHASLARRIGEPRAATVTTVLAFFIIVGPAITVLTMLAAEITPLVQNMQAGSLALPTPPDLQALVRVAAAEGAVPPPRRSDVDARRHGAGRRDVPRRPRRLHPAERGELRLPVVRDDVRVVLLPARRRPIVRAIRKLLPFEPARRDRMIAQTHELVVATVGSTFAVAITQGR